MRYIATRAGADVKSLTSSYECVYYVKRDGTLLATVMTRWPFDFWNLMLRAASANILTKNCLCEWSRGREASRRD